MKLLVIISILALSILFLEYQIIELRSKVREAFLNLESTYSQEISNLELQINNLEQKLRESEKRLTETQSALNSLKERISRKLIVQPSYAELLNFIREDKTDELKFIEENNQFVCTDFANTFVRNFREKGFYSCTAILYFSKPPNSSHAIVAVNTTDLGLVYVEPQTDDIIFSLKEGDNYCEKANFDCTWIIQHVKSCFQ